MTFLQIEPQSARGTLCPEMWDDPDWYVEEKWDGDRRIAQFCGDLARFTGRKQSVKDGLFVEKTDNIPHLSGVPSNAAPRFLPPKVLDGTVLDGEMIADALHGSLTEGKSKFVTRIMGSGANVAIQKQLIFGWLHYVVFDCLFYMGQDIRELPITSRTTLAAKALAEWRNPFVKMSAQVYKDKRAFLAEVLARGGEGVVFKHKNHRYGDQTLWVKLKQVWNADVVVMGFADARKVSKKVSGKVSPTKYAQAGLIGAIRCGQYKDGKLVEVATVSGISDALRAELTVNGKMYIGGVLEISHNGREPSGRFRHPQFGDFRQDKDAKHCVYWEEET